MERIIRVTGKGKISVKPDTIRLLITQSTKFASIICVTYAISSR